MCIGGLCKDVWQSMYGFMLADRKVYGRSCLPYQAICLMSVYTLADVQASRHAFGIWTLIDCCTGDKKQIRGFKQWILCMSINKARLIFAADT